MKFPFLASVVIFLLVLHHNLRKGTKIGKKQEDSFWKKEQEANTTRKQPMNDLVFISFSAEEFFPLSLLPADKVSEFISAYPQVKAILPRFLQLSEAKIVDLSSYTNTDLKFKYGVANFNLLSEYDENYISLVSLLQQYGHCLFEAGYADAALRVLTYAISIGSDVTETYLLAVQLLQQANDKDALNEVLQKASSLPAKRSSVIFRKLKESGLSVDLPHSV